MDDGRLLPDRRTRGHPLDPGLLVWTLLLHGRRVAAGAAARAEHLPVAPLRGPILGALPAAHAGGRRRQHRRRGGLGRRLVGFCVISMMEGVVFGLQVEDARVLAGCTGFVAALAVGVGVFWVSHLRRRRGGGSPTLPTAAALLNFAHLFP